MKKILKYRVIHYFFEKTSLEFINIGIFVYNENYFDYKLMDKELIDSIKCNFINKKVFKKSLQYIRQIFHNVQNVEQLNKQSLYFDNFSFSNEFFTKVGYDEREEILSLYKQYVLYKFPEHREYHSWRDKIKEKSYEIIEKEFRKDFKILKDDKLKLFDIVLKATKKDKVYPVLLGSLKNSDDISRAIRANVDAQLLQLTNLTFGHIYKIEGKKDMLSLDMIKKIDYNVEDFSEEEKIRISLEEIAKN